MVIGRDELSGVVVVGSDFVLCIDGTTTLVLYEVVETTLTMVPVVFPLTVIYKKNNHNYYIKFHYITPFCTFSVKVDGVLVKCTLSKNTYRQGLSW